jgi:type I restriction enzyme, S subunit
MTDLPPGWALARLDDVADIQGGIQKQPKRRPTSNKYPFLRVANVARGQLDLSEIHEVELFDGELERYRLEAGDLLVVEGNGSPGQLGRAAMWRGQVANCVHQNHLIRVRATRAMNAQYLAYLWNSPFIIAQIERAGASTSGLHTLSVSKLKPVAIPVPPLAEQRRIVVTLDANLARLDVGRRLLLGAKKRLSTLSTTLLAGLLSPGVNKWKEMSMNEICTSIRNGCFVSRPGSTPCGVPILRIGAVRTLQLDLNDLRYSGLTSSELCKSDHLLETGDILFTRYNGNSNYVGACAVVPSISHDLTYPDKLIRVKVNAAVADPEFVALACSSCRARAQIRSLVKTTAGQAGISGRDLKTIRVRLPDLSTQYRIVNEHRERMSDITRLYVSFAHLVKKSARLHRSLLTDAFTGQLVPQDPSNEQASLLLARNKIEQQARPRTMRTRSISKKPDVQRSLL